MMDQQPTNPNRPVNPRRKKRTPMQIFKEHYLPLIIVALTAIMLLVIITGSITRAIQRNKLEKEVAVAVAEEDARIKREALTIEDEAARFAAMYDYRSAIELIDNFSGDIDNYPALAMKRAQYESADSQMVVWDDPSKILNLSFHTLVVDPARAFQHPEEGDTFLYHYVTTTEFSNILTELYNNDYILVSLDDFVTTEVSASGESSCISNTLRLPAGKKPLILTHTNPNYDYFMVDSDGDMLADANSCGVAHKLVVQGGKVMAEYYDSDGTLLTGAYDFIPILDAFIENHPDFSYKGAKAIIAMTGHEGLFGYRTDTKSEEYFGTAYRDSEIASAKAVAQTLVNNGYELASYTFSNVAYGYMSLNEVETDQTRWLNEVTPVIGLTDILVYAKASDITTEEQYSGDIYEFLKNAGYVHFLGLCGEGKPWTTITGDYVRQGRIQVNGNNLKNHADWFDGILDPSNVLDNTARTVS